MTTTTNPTDPTNLAEAESIVKAILDWIDDFRKVHRRSPTLTERESFIFGLHAGIVAGLRILR